MHLPNQLLIFGQGTQPDYSAFWSCSAAIKHAVLTNCGRVCEGGGGNQSNFCDGPTCSQSKSLNFIYFNATPNHASSYATTNLPLFTHHLSLWPPIQGSNETSKNVTTEAQNYEKIFWKRDHSYKLSYKSVTSVILTLVSLPSSSSSITVTDYSLPWGSSCILIPALQDLQFEENMAT